MEEGLDIVHSSSVTQYPIAIMVWDKIQTNAFITHATSPALNWIQIVNDRMTKLICFNDLLISIG